MATDKKDLWVGWTHEAMSKYTPPDGKVDTDELVEDMVEVTTGYADAMLEEFENRFGDNVRGETRRQRKPKED